MLSATRQEQMNNAVFVLREFKVGQKQNKTKGIVLATWLVRRPQWGRENKFRHVGWIRY